MASSLRRKSTPVVTVRLSQQYCVYSVVYSNYQYCNANRPFDSVLKSLSHLRVTVSRSSTITSRGNLAGHIDQGCFVLEITLTVLASVSRVVSTVSRLPYTCTCSCKTKSKSNLDLYLQYLQFYIVPSISHSVTPLPVSLSVSQQYCPESGLELVTVRIQKSDRKGQVSSCDVVVSLTLCHVTM